ncbi:MAG: GNAT family N-acetyltransferase [Anaerolineales bacterium]|nr:MAG: GNAT family N-acetyltransferase [Anaerolineales bacterium]
MKEKIETLHISLPEGFTVRGANLNDIQPAIEMINAWSQSVIQQDDITDAGAIRTEWGSPGFDPARDIRLVVSPKGEMAGYIEVWTNAKPPVHPWIWGRVHPDFDGLGIGTWLLQWAEAHACRVLDDLPADLRFAPRTGTLRAAVDSKKLFEDRGFSYIRSFHQMHIEMDEAPPPPLWPEGITVRTADPEKDIQTVYAAAEESFRDHFGHIPEPFEEGFARFKHFFTGEGYDPTVWFLAMDGDEIAGVSLCRPRSYEDADLGWVNTLGVRRPWRKKGLGLALLQHSFGEFFRRGKRKVGLGVDAENLTGALRLYEKAGMHVHLVFDTYEKTIRTGREISVESLSE